MPTTQQFFWVGLPVFVGFVALEFVILWRQGRAYSWKEGATSLAIGIGNKLSTTYKLGFAIWATHAGVGCDVAGQAAATPIEAAAEWQAVRLT